MTTTFVEFRNGVNKFAAVRMQNLQTVISGVGDTFQLVSRYKLVFGDALEEIFKIYLFLSLHLCGQFLIWQTQDTIGMIFSPFV